MEKQVHRRASLLKISQGSSFIAGRAQDYVNIIFKLKRYSFLLEYPSRSDLVQYTADPYGF